MRTLTNPRVPHPSAIWILPWVTVVAAAVLAVAPIASAAQAVTVGGVAGLSRSRQILERSSDSDPRDGFVAGAWMAVETPKPLLHVLTEAAYARRGGRFPVAGPTGLTGNVDSDWVTFAAAPMLRVAMGPVAAFAYAGPMLELHVRTRSAAALRNAFATPSDQGFSAVAGAGLEGRLQGWSVRCEARVVAGMSPAYSGSAGDIRHRSAEVLLRVGRRREAVISPDGPR